MLIWFLIFQYFVNLVLAIIFWKKIDDSSNGQNKKLTFVNVTIYKNFILAVCHVINFHPRYNDMDKLTWHWKIRNQINTIERLETKVKYDIKDRD